MQNPDAVRRCCRQRVFPMTALGFSGIHWRTRDPAGGAKGDKHSPPASDEDFGKHGTTWTGLVPLVLSGVVRAKPPMPAHQSRFAKRKRAPPSAAPGSF